VATLEEVLSALSWSTA